MHIPDGILDPPVCLVTGGLAAAAFGYSLYRARENLSQRMLPLTGMTASLIFAGQMVNFPLVVAPVSGHLLGGVLAAALLGPWAGSVAMAMVLFVQVALFADGGWTSLGANYLNMGIIGCWGGGAILQLTRSWFKDPVRGLIVGAVWGSWLSVLAGAALFCLEFASSTTVRGYDLRHIFFLMILFHAVIGVGEAIITSLILAFLYRLRPDLLALNPVTSSTQPTRLGSFSGAMLLLALAIAAFLSPFASSHPDGLEAVAESTKVADLSRDTWAIWWEDYKLPRFEGNWEGTGTAIVGIIGTLAVLLLTTILVRLLVRNQSAGVAPLREQA
ncbi:MAG: energy-coupling factor ABC transporter permease [Planctomycetales bacterium]